MSIHRTLDGHWAACATPEICKLRYHFQDLSLAEAEVLPMQELWPLFEIGDPPTYVHEGTKAWSILLGKRQVLHREYDLPARTLDLQIKATRPIAEWFHKGHLHREGDRPAMIWSDGTLEWYHLGYRHREGGKPAVLRPNGGTEYWDMGHQL